MSQRVAYVIAVLILLIAGAIRIWQLPTLPVGFNDLEIAHIDVMRDEVQTGDIRVFYQIGETEDGRPIGQEGLYHLILSGFALVIGEGTFGLRIFSVLLGMLTVATLFALGRRLFGQVAGLATAGLYSVLMFPILLSRLVIVESALPLVVAAIMLSMARTLPVYARSRDETTNTIDYATMGTLIALSLYLHQASLFIVLMAMIFVTYLLFVRRPISLRRLSYIGFSLLMLIIISMPYFISSIRLDNLSANTRLFGDYGQITVSILDIIFALFWRGDASFLYNLSGRPLMDVLSALLVIFGAIVCIQKWREPQYGLILIALTFLAPPAILGGASPNYLNMTVLMPVIVLLFGVGFSSAQQRLSAGTMRNLSYIGLIAIIGVNLIWTSDTLFNDWAQSDEVYLAYNGDIGSVAHHFDLTANDIPIVVCNPYWNIPRAPQDPITDVGLITLHMNRDNALLREVDCRNGFLFVNAGTHQQVLLADPMQIGELAPSVADWLSLGTSVPDLPQGMVIDMQVRQELENELGVFTTTAPASFATETDISERFPVAPPIRFGGNVTWLGYEIDPIQEYSPSMFVPVSTYWRIEGLVPSDLLIFTHLLADPVFPSAQVDAIYVNPTQVRESDVYLHNVGIALPPTIADGTYAISVGLYQETSDERLPVFTNEDEPEIRGNRIFLYSILIDSLTNTEN